MNKLTFDVSNKNIDIHELERLRSIVSYRRDQIVTTHYIEQFNNKNLLVFLAYVGKELAGVMYLSSVDYTLIVDQLFVMPDMQNSKYHVGTGLLKQVEANKENIQKFFDAKFSRSIIEPADRVCEKIYRDFGYQNTNTPGKLYKHL
jgi:hypothetical protein